MRQKLNLLGFIIALLGMVMFVAKQRPPKNQPAPRVPVVPTLTQLVLYNGQTSQAFLVDQESLGLLDVLRKKAETVDPETVLPDFESLSRADFVLIDHSGRTGERPLLIGLHPGGRLSRTPPLQQGDILIQPALDDAIRATLAFVAERGALLSNYDPPIPLE